MARRMIDPKTIIKSQVVDDKYSVDLHEILEKYGTPNEWGLKSITLQFYTKVVRDDNALSINNDTDIKGYIILNGAITMAEDASDNMYIGGLIVDNTSDMNLLQYIEILAGDYENGIILSSAYPFDIHVIKV